MKPYWFVIKWEKSKLKERSSSHEHFLDLCQMFDHPKPAEVDSTGEEFTFERGATKLGGGHGWADVWKRHYFGWEYKGKHKDLDAAYRQLQDYREDLENPPLLVVSDMDRIIVRTNFTDTAVQKYEIPLSQFDNPVNLKILRSVFHAPQELMPGAIREYVTTEAAKQIGEIAQTLRGSGIEAHRVARFLDRIVFCLFAEDVRLLPEDVFSQIVKKSKNNPTMFSNLLQRLFEAMQDGGYFGADEIRWFNGGLFNDSEVLPLSIKNIEQIRRATMLDWGAVDPSIFGTLFERGLDPNNRSQLGAHYTSREDIEVIVEPVVMQPLRREWEEVRRQSDSLIQSSKKNAAKKSEALLNDFIIRLGNVTVLDPACGSGNFLYVTLRKLKDLEKEVTDYAFSLGFNLLAPVGPWQLHGIEINPYAHDLAQMTVWIGYLQWKTDHGYLVADKPVLRSMDNFKLMDAIINLSDPDNPKEPEWPKVDFIVGNPPFLGGKKMRSELGDDYINALFSLWKNRVRPEADLCCYWFEKARRHIESGKCKRSGLLATQGIRGGANRATLKRIKETGDIFFAESDRPWVLDGANVHVSMVGFDGGSESERTLDGALVPIINPNLTSAANTTAARVLPANQGVAFMGDTKGGSFEIPFDTAVLMLQSPNPNGLPNSQVLVPWINGIAVTRREPQMFIVDFGLLSEAESCKFEKPFEYLREYVLPERRNNKREAYRLNWWHHAEARPGMRASISNLTRFVATVAVSKHRLFVWMQAPVLPDHALFVFARSDDYSLGMLHSRVHEVWSRAQGTQVRERESGFRYTPTTCFETFPFPLPDNDQVASISEAARELNELRESWLNPLEWTREEIFEFPGSADGPWARYVHDPNDRGIGTVRYPRIVPKDEECASMLANRTLTNLYNQRPTWLDLAHRKLDEAVFIAYGWDSSITDEDLLQKLLELNLARSL
ncbi:MAG: N-6 DNA methylase [Armatimonadota bacterium]|nr:N-6 DNA methylase [Armatimonadota bacterium]